MEPLLRRDAGSPARRGDGRSLPRASAHDAGEPRWIWSG